MIKNILLLLPVFVSVFWAITLSGNSEQSSKPRLFLSKFMIFPAFIFFGHFLFFEPYIHIFPYFDILFQFASLLAFPLYYIYFRLLTVDEQFSIKRHFRYLVIPLVVGIVNAILVFITPFAEYKTWLFDRNFEGSSLALQWLSIVRFIIYITYLTGVILSVVGSSLLLKKYGDRAEHFYSDVHDGKYNNSKRLNISFIMLGITAFVITAIGKYNLSLVQPLIYVGWPLFTFELYIMGYMGLRQKAINPTYDVNIEIPEIKEAIISGTQKKLFERIMVLFNEDKIYLNSQLTILDVANTLGTNRTYISYVINQHFNQNFAFFVNNLRIEQLKREYILHPEYSNEILAEICGFGSLSSMKRVVSIHLEMSISELKKKIHSEATRK
ncbi:MAG: helix-turn-helix domain-containing protein [Paludibacter sp.]